MVASDEKPRRTSDLTRAAVELPQRLLTDHHKAGLRRSMILLVLVVLGGTLGYVLIEGWTPWDALYMTVISVTTVGYKEIHPLSRRGELFTMIVLTVGVATVLYTFSFLMARLV